MTLLVCTSCLERMPGYVADTGTGDTTGDTGGTAAVDGAGENGDQPGTGATADDSDTTATTATTGLDGSTSAGGSDGTGASTSEGGGTTAGGTTSNGTASSGTSSGETASSGSTAEGSTSTGTATTGGGTSHLIFHTSTLVNGAFGGLLAGDLMCQSRASAAGLPGLFVALLSTSTVAARDRVVIVGAVYNTVGDPVAQNADDLWDGSVVNPVAYDEFGMGGPSVTWTGTQPDGNAGVNCLDWTTSDNMEYGTQGFPNASNGSWVSSSDDRCFKVKGLYCVSQ